MSFHVRGTLPGACDSGMPTVLFHAIEQGDAGAAAQGNSLMPFRIGQLRHPDPEGCQ